MNDSARPASPDTITFAIPFYRGQSFLERAIQSVIEQDCSNWRLIVSDDCGPETGTEELVRAWNDPRIRFVRNAVNLGMVGNWNRCLNLAETDLVTLLHADDELLPNYASLMLAEARKHPLAAALFCRATIIDAHGRPTFSLPDLIKRFIRPAVPRKRVCVGPAALAVLMKGNFIMCPTLCYRKSVLGSRRFEAGWRFVQDMEFITRLLLAGDELIELPVVAYRYRRHSENATVAYTQDYIRFQEEAQLYARVQAQARKQGWDRAARVAGNKSIIRLHLVLQAIRELTRCNFGGSFRALGMLID